MHFYTDCCKWKCLEFYFRTVFLQAFRHPFLKLEINMDVFNKMCAVVTMVHDRWRKAKNPQFSIWTAGETASAKFHEICLMAWRSSLWKDGNSGKNIIEKWFSTCAVLLCFAVYILCNTRLALWNFTLMQVITARLFRTTNAMKWPIPWFEGLVQYCVLHNVATVAALISKCLPLVHKQVTVLCLLHPMLHIKRVSLLASL